MVFSASGREDCGTLNDHCDSATASVFSTSVVTNEVPSRLHSSVFVPEPPRSLHFPLTVSFPAVKLSSVTVSPLGGVTIVKLGGVVSLVNFVMFVRVVEFPALSLAVAERVPPSAATSVIAS